MRMEKQIFIIDDVHPLIVDGLKNAGYIVIDATKFTRAELLLRVNEAYGLVLRSRINVDREFLLAATNLRFVARVGAGMETIDMDFCTERGIVCLNSPEGNRDAVGEHVIGMILSLLNNLSRADKQVKAGKWQREINRGRELGSMTVGIIGYGNMGQSLAKKLSGFGTKVLAYDKYKSAFSDNFAIEATMLQIFEQADLLSLHVPLTSETHYLVNEQFLSQFAKPIVLINAARGPVVKTADLVAAMKSGKVLAAGLDVIEYEETSFEKTRNMLDEADFCYLAQSENALLTPHIAGWTVESKYKLAKVLLDKIIELG